ncbi:MAG: hypothetical protein ABII12_00315 [Planctomycetota bacterium]
MKPLRENNPLRRWLAGLVESSFQEDVGLSNPDLLDYIADLLTEFIHMERISQLCDGSGRTVEDVAAMLSVASSPPIVANTERQRELHRHIGDYTLFWTGVYPENLKRMHHRQARDGLLDYFEQGKYSYAIASRLSTPDTTPPASVLQRLSEDFEYCVYGLGLVRKGWEQAGGTGPTPGELLQP